MSLADELERKPLGFAAAAGEWDEAFAGRPMNEGDWNRLTMGEQWRYCAEECRTKGAVYSSKITADRIEFSVSLPPDLAMKGLTAGEVAKIERELHKVLEDRIAVILQCRELYNGRLP